jgi:hypothetical protein
MATVIPFSKPEIPAKAQLKEVSDYSIQYGAKYDKALDIAEIAKRVRADLKALVKARTIPQGKYSVTIQRFSGGCSLKVKMDQLTSPSLMLNPERVKFEKENPHAFPGHLPQFSSAGKALLNTVESVVNAYNFDGSDTASDYWNVNFYGSVDFATPFCQAQRALILEWME